MSADSGEEPRPSSDEMDEKRQRRMAYLYLCHLEETRLWLSSCIQEDLPAATNLEESLRDGVYLARLSHFFAPDEVPLRKIYDADQSIHLERGLCFRHTDNINHWLNAMRAIDFPEYFFPDPFDLYEKKNLPKVIYCLHALSLYLFHLGKAPRIEDLIGKLRFSDEEVEQVRRNLLVNAEVPMPKFNLIDGVLAKETSADSTAVIAINTAIDRGEADLLFETLAEPSALLRGVRQENVERYREVLECAKASKLKQRAMRRLEGSSEEEASDDMYDRLLSLAEIQGYVLETNVNVLLGEIEAAMEDDDMVLFAELLVLRKDLGVHGIIMENVPAYFQVLTKIMEDACINSTGFTLSRSDLQVAVLLANEKVEEESRLEAAIVSVNMCLDCGRPDDTFEALRDPAARLPNIYPLAASLYHNQFAFIRREAGHNLSHEELIGGVRILNAIAEVNFALKAGGAFDVTACLANQHAHIADVRPLCSERYEKALRDALADKDRSDAAGAFLTHTEIQDVVNRVNAEEDGEADLEDAMDRINGAVALGDTEATMQALLDPAAGIVHLSRDHVLLYLELLAVKQRSLEEDRPLSAEDVQEVVDIANQIAVEASDMCIGLATLNVGVCNQSSEDVRAGLESLKVAPLFCGDDANATVAYLRELRRLYLEKRAPFAFEPIEWFSYPVRPGLFFTMNVVQFRSEWSTVPQGDYLSFLTQDDVRDVVLRVNERLEEERTIARLTPLLTQLQACARGFLIRCAVRDQYNFYCEHMKQIVRLQAWFRSVLQRRKYRRMLDELQALVPFVVRLQSHARGYLARKRVLDIYDHYRGREDVVKFVQTRYRAHRAYRDYQLITKATPTVPVLQRFLHMLDISEEDLCEEMHLQRVKEKVVATIRHNQALEKEVFQMDIRIGLLVRNCITLEDVMGHHGSKTTLAAVKSDWLHGSGGLTALSRRSRQRLDAYQHLFYMLQVDPHYLAKLIFIIPAAVANSTVESVIYAVYNYGSTPRDEYLLLRLFRFAIQEEVRSKLEKPSDILRGNPLVVRMVVGFFRTRGGHNCLELFLAPLVKGVLEDSDLKIELNPVDIYKKWVNDMETMSGKPSGLSYEVTEDEALQHADVYKILHTSVLQLENIARLFARTIADSKSKLPYGMLYLCKVLKKALEEKFPQSVGEEITKVIGNILYYRYLNPGVVAPETFGVVNLEPESPVTNVQRRNLGIISKILSCATSGAPYSHQHPYQIRLNNLIDACKEILHGFFVDACNVPEPEERFSVDSYSEATFITPPTITLTALELRSTHRLLLEHRDDIAEDPQDPLHTLLDELGPEPTLEDLVGNVGGDAADVAVLSATKVSLSLYGKFSEEEEDTPETDQLLRDTKYMLVELLKVFRHADTVDEILHGEDGPHLERAFLEVQAAVRTPKVSTASLLGRRKYGSLSAFRKALLRNLDVLEARGLTTAKDDYQAVMNSIATDILQKRNRRINRRRELANLQATQDKLDVKMRYYEETLDYYRRYVDACLTKLSAGKSRRQSYGHVGAGGRSSGDCQPRPLKSRGPLKYSGWKLHEKGILLEVSGLETAQLKGVSFEIAPTDRAGVFSVRAKFLGVSADEVTIDIEDLLRRQYEGVAVTRLCGRARVNNNLLLYFLNKKFYRK